MSDGWEGILDDDEHILWQGRPKSAVRFGLAQIGLAAFGLFFAGFAVVWMLIASSAGSYFWLFGLPFLFVGLGITFGIPIWTAHLRRNSHYTLTNKRAFIAVDVVGRKSLNSYPITPESQIEFLDGPTQTIHFALITKYNKNRSYQTPVGFENIQDGRTVLRLMRDLQQGVT